MEIQTSELDVARRPRARRRRASEALVASYIHQLSPRHRAERSQVEAQRITR